MKKIRFIIIQHSPKFWEVRPPTKYAMRRLGEIIRQRIADQQRRTP